jgi:two-component system cell cycle response regulator
MSSGSESVEVLLVEPDAVLARRIEKELSVSRRPAFRVRRCPDLPSAIEEASARRGVVLAEAVILDDGGAPVQAAVYARTAEIPIVVLAAAPNEDREWQLARRGFQDCVSAAEIDTGALARAIRFAIERGRRLGRLREASMRDDLTGFYNRRGFFRIAEQHLRVAARLGSAVRLVFADVDGMKSCNDRLGHSQGDALLAKAARVLRHTFRASDVIGRLGGDEFAVLALEGGDGGGQQLASRVAEVLDRENRRHPEPCELSLTIGLAATGPLEDASLDDLLRQADDWMYSHKRRKKTGGRHTVTLEGLPE